jgi:hypothetical protein
MSLYVIYDNKCSFCTSFAHWVITKNSDINILPVRSEMARKLLKERGFQFISLMTIYFITEKIVYTKSSAIFNIYRTFKFPLCIFYVFSITPKFITDYFYNLFSKHRYKINLFQNSKNI